MSGIARWQLAVHYLGEVAMFAGVAWGLYRMLALHACPTARFNDLSLIVLGLGTAILPLHPFGPSAGYLSRMFQHNSVLARSSWMLALSGVVFAIYAQWFKLPNAVWFIALLPAAFYMWFGIPALGKPKQQAQTGSGEGARDA
jgi:hypothetical protein